MASVKPDLAKFPENKCHLTPSNVREVLEEERIC